MEYAGKNAFTSMGWRVSSSGSAEALFTVSWNKNVLICSDNLTMDKGQTGGANRREPLSGSGGEFGENMGQTNLNLFATRFNKMNLFFSPIPDPGKGEVDTWTTS